MTPPPLEREEKPRRWRFAHIFVLVNMDRLLSSPFDCFFVFVCGKWWKYFRFFNCAKFRTKKKNNNQMEDLPQRLRIAIGFEGSANKIGIGIVREDGHILANVRYVTCFSFYPIQANSWRSNHFPIIFDTHFTSILFQFLQTYIYYTTWNRLLTPWNSTPSSRMGSSFGPQSIPRVWADSRWYRCSLLHKRPWNGRTASLHCNCSTHTRSNVE